MLHIYFLEKNSTVAAGGGKRVKPPQQGYRFSVNTSFPSNRKHQMPGLVSRLLLFGELLPYKKRTLRRLPSVHIPCIRCDAYA